LGVDFERFDPSGSLRGRGLGSGIGGLTAGALLVKRGLEPLVIEQHYLPGGACTTMRREGIIFDVGVAMMFGFGATGFNPHRFVMNEIEEEIDVIPHETGHAHGHERGNGGEPIAIS
jgi:phytoene dehydrogenase-like protein